MKNILILAFTFLIFGSTYAQNSEAKINIEDLWTNYKFYGESSNKFNFLNDGKHYIVLKDNVIQSYDITTGKKSKVIFDPADHDYDAEISSYIFSKDEKLILLESEKEQIYRRSSRSIYHVYNRKTKKLMPVLDGVKISDPDFSPDGKMVAYVLENDLYYIELSANTTTRITTDGEKNAIINGATDWVYEEEFGFTQAYEWNSNGSSIAFIRFDERAVKEFTMTNYTNELYPEYYTFKYPKVGEKNAQVTAHVYSLLDKKTKTVDLGKDYEYIPRIKWTNDQNTVLFYTMNRHQNKLNLKAYDTQQASVRNVLTEESKYYVDIHDDMEFISGSSEYVWTSQKDGFNHIYIYDLSGKVNRQLTSGEYDVTKVYGVDEKSKKLYFQAAMVNPMSREIYSIDLNGKNLKAIVDQKGTNDVQFSSTYDYYVLTNSSANKPRSVSVHNKAGKKVRQIVDNKRVANLMNEYKTSEVEFMQIPTENNVQLNAYMIKPNNFDESKKYPLFMYVYGGPGSQTVKDAWIGQNYWWFQMLAEEGYIVVSVDNRGTGARGEEFKKMTYKELGKYETVDQINAAKYLGDLSYIDSERIGIFGWSYGGYMSSLAITKGADVFNAAIAVAPVTNWKWYDSVYTERYMQTEKENPDGFANNSPVNFAHLLEGKYLLIHGGSDDNVHFQNSAEMANALILAGKQFDTYFYPNRNHGIYGGNARAHLYTKMTDFILENL